MQLEGRTCLITGASKGIGRALAAVLLEDGARVVISARGAERLEGARAALASQGDVAAVAGDVGDDQDAARMVAEATERFGSLDLLVNNAAILPEPAPVASISAETWNDVLRVNVTGTANLIRHALPVMAAQGSGVIANISSTWGRSAAAHQGPYCASKFAVEALTTSLAGEVPNGIVTFAVNPGIIATDMLARAFGSDVSMYTSPEELAPAWRRLLGSVDASWNGRSVDLG